MVDSAAPRGDFPPDKLSKSDNRLLEQFIAKDASGLWDSLGVRRSINS